VALTAADALQHRASPEETVHGLRGGHQVGIAAEGTFTETLRHDSRLHGYAFVPGVQVSGTVRFRTTDYATGNLGGRAVAVVTARDETGARLGSFVVRWRTDTRDATATVTGLVPGPRPGTVRTVRAETPAP
jgi:hypothetical protein